MTSPSLPTASVSARPGPAALATAVLSLIVTFALLVGAAPATAHDSAQRSEAGLAALKAINKKPTAGDDIRFRGTAPASWRNKRVEVQRREGKGKWMANGRARVRDSGVVKFTRRAAGVGLNSYRLKLNDKTSTVARVRVFKFYYLSSLNPIATEIEGRSGGCTGGCTGFDSGSTTIAGKNYPRSYVMRVDDDADRSTSTWNASRKCKSFKATVGPTDVSGSSSVNFTIEGDGSPEDLGTYFTGTDNDVSYDMRGVFRFIIAAYNAGPGEDVESGWGNARLLCSGRP